MNVTHKITMDLTRPTNGNQINVVEGDKNSRIVNVHLYENFVSWRVPTNASVLIKWERESGVGGEYSQLPDGSSAWSAVGNILTIILSDESTEYSGNVKFSIVLTTGDSQISTFVIVANVHSVANGREGANSGTSSTDIAGLQKQIGNLSDLETKNKSNLVMAINEVAANGGGSGGSAGTPGKDGGYYTPKVSQPTDATMQMAFTPSKAGMPAVEPVTINLPVGSDSSQNGDGLTETASNLLIAILRNGIYSTDQSANITALENAIAGNGEEPDVPDEPTHTHSYTSSVTTAATCEAAGVRTYACSCGHSYTEEIPATGHNYEDGVCTNCGAADPDYEPSEDNGWVSGTEYTDIVWTDGYHINNTTGEPVENTSYSISDFFPCKGVDAFSTTNNNNYDIWLYDDSKKLVMKRALSKMGILVASTIDANGNTPAYMRSVCRTSNVQLGKDTPFVVPYKLPTATPTTVLEAGKYYAPVFKVGVSVWNDTGVESETETSYCTDFIFVKDFASVSICTTDTVSRKWIGFYDSEKNFISGEANNNVTRTVPENAYYCRISSNNFPGIKWWIMPNAAEEV